MACWSARPWTPIEAASRSPSTHRSDTASAAIEVVRPVVAVVGVAAVVVAVGVEDSPDEPESSSASALAGAPKKLKEWQLNQEAASSWCSSPPWVPWASMNGLRRASWVKAVGPGPWGDDVGKSAEAAQPVGSAPVEAASSAAAADDAAALA